MEHVSSRHALQRETETLRLDYTDRSKGGKEQRLVSPSLAGSTKQNNLHGDLYYFVVGEDLRRHDEEHSKKVKKALFASAISCVNDLDANDGMSTPAHGATNDKSMPTSSRRRHRERQVKSDDESTFFLSSL